MIITTLQSWFRPRFPHHSFSVRNLDCKFNSERHIFLKKFSKQFYLLSEFLPGLCWEEDRKKIFFFISVYSRWLNCCLLWFIWVYWDRWYRFLSLGHIHFGRIYIYRVAEMYCNQLQVVIICKPLVGQLTDLFQWQFILLFISSQKHFDLLHSEKKLFVMKFKRDSVIA